MPEPYFKAMQSEDVLIPQSFGAGPAIFACGRTDVVVQLLDQHGEPWSIMFTPEDAFSLAQMVLQAYGMVRGYAEPREATGDSLRRLLEGEKDGT